MSTISTIKKHYENVYLKVPYIHHKYIPSNDDFSSCLINLSFSGENGNSWDAESWTWAITGVNHNGEESAFTTHINSDGASSMTSQCNMHFYIK